MDLDLRCQSCARPLGEGSFGSKADGSTTKDYCQICYQDGQFSEPNLTLPEMITKSVNHMKSDLDMEEDIAQALAEQYIPKLKRWQGK